MQMSGGRSVASRRKMDGKDLCGRYLVCPKHGEEALVARVGRVRGDEGREVMGTTGPLALFCFKMQVFLLFRHCEANR